MTDRPKGFEFSDEVDDQVLDKIWDEFGEGNLEDVEEEVFGDYEGEWVKVEKADILTEGRILKSDIKQRYTLGVVYEPMELDTQEEYADAEEIRKGCWEFNRLLKGNSQINKIALEVLESILKSFQENKELTLDITDLVEEVEKAGGGLGFMHELWDEGLGEIIESYTAPCDMVISTPRGLEPVKKGAWLMGIIWSPEYFAKVEAGEITGLSMGGKATKIPVKEVK